MDRARPLLDKAISIYERLDAARDLARAEAVLREAGIRRGRRGSRRRPQIGWDSLTPAERTVAGLVAEGLSNPQIGRRLYISGRTVQTHLAHVFAKLDITARTQLAAEVSRHQRSEPADVAGPQVFGATDIPALSSGRHGRRSLLTSGTRRDDGLRSWVGG